MAFKNKHGQLVIVNPTSPMHNKAYAAQVYARDLHTLEMGEARELYHNYFLKDKAGRNEWLAKRLARCEKLYGAGSSERVRKCMGVVKGELTEPLKA